MFALNRLILTGIVFVSGMACAAPFTLDEGAETSGTWGYRPAEGAKIAVNPPAFTWYPDGKAQSYTLEIATDTDFRDVVHTVAETPWSAHAPDKVLPAGTCYWRYRGHGEAESLSNWSKTRTFVLPEGLPAFPKPAREDLIPRIPGGHPRLFLRPEQVEGLREAGGDTLKAQYEAVIAAADKVLENPPETAEPPKYPPGTERKGESWKKIWWGNRTYGIRLTEGAANCAFAYRLTGDARYGAMARDLIMAFADWDPKGSTNYEYNDEAAMPLLYWPSRAYTWAHDAFSDEDRAKLTAVMAVRGKDCFDHLRKRKHLWNPYASHSNRAWHFLGELATVFHDTIPEAPQWLDYAYTIFYTCYPVWGDTDGGWHEGTAYWSSYLSRFMWWAMNSQVIYGIDPFDKPFFSQTGYYGLYTLPPGSKTGAWGDQATRTTSASIAPLMAQLAAGARNPHWQWYADQHDAAPAGGWFGLLYAARKAGLTGQAPDELPTSRKFDGTGVAVLNTNLLDGAANNQLHFKSSPMGRQSHGYNAHNAFLLNLNGQPVFVRSGRRDVYGSPHHTQWMWETKSDNAILVNGEGQEKHTASPGGHITQFSTSADRDEVVGEAGAAYGNLDRWTRRIIFLKPDIVIIHDVLEAPGAATFQWLLHARGSFEIVENGARWRGEAGKVAVNFVSPNNLKISQTDAFDPPPHDWAKFDLGEWHLTAETRDPKVREQFVTILVIGDSDGTVVHEQANETHTITIDRHNGAPGEVISLGP